MPTIPWTKGRAVDPPSEGMRNTAETVVMASRFDLKEGSQVPAFLFAAVRIRRQMLVSPGIVGVSLIAKPLRKTFFTLSAWRDRDALNAAVAHEPHAETMARFHDRMAASRFVFWTVPQPGMPPPWSDALRRLEDAS